MSSPYYDFAQIYDACMDDIPYEAWAGFLKRQFDEYGIAPGALVLDLGCGTGTFTLLLRDLGYDMIGADISESMLEVAREKYYESLENEEESGEPKAPVLFLQQDMRSFELYGTVGAVVAMCDTMNYASGPEDLETVFRLVNNYLDPGGLFIFDLKTRHYFHDVVGDRTFTDVRDDMALIWENEFEEETGKNTYRLTMFLENEEGTYERSEEVHEQNAFSAETVKRAIEKSGLRLERVYEVGEDGTAQDATGREETAERLFFVCREQMK